MVAKAGSMFANCEASYPNVANCASSRKNALDSNYWNTGVCCLRTIDMVLFTTWDSYFIVSKGCHKLLIKLQRVKQ